MPLKLDLSPLRGRAVVLRIEASAGPKGNPSFDHGIVKQPRIIAEDPRPQPIVLHSPKKIASVIGPNGELAFKGSSKNLYSFTAPIPSNLFMIFGQPSAVQLPLDLRRTPFSAALVGQDGVETAPHDFLSPHMRNASVGGVAKPALSAHPPANGRLVLDYLLKLPAQPSRLLASAGIGDGSKSRGVGFRVQLNGGNLWSADLLPGAWKPVEVDLARYTNQTVVLSLVTDALGDYNFDWAVWGEPRLNSAARFARSSNR